MGPGRQAVASGAAEFLVVGFDVAGQVGVGDVAHVGLVDAHAEGDGGDHDHAVPGHEGILIGLALGLVHAGVVGQGGNAVPLQQQRRRLGLLARQAIDDAALAAVFGRDRQQLFLPVALERHREPDVGPVEAVDECLGVAAEQPLHDLAPGRGVRGGGEGGQRRFREQRTQPLQLRVFGPERRTPLGDAVGLVDHEQSHRQARERRDHAFGHEPFGREIEQLGFAARDPVPGGDVLGALAPGIDGLRAHPGEPERGDLVLHQRHQRRDHDGEPAQHQGRDLEAERLARAGGHDRERVAARQNRVHHRLLAGPEGLEAEDLAQDPVLFGVVFAGDGGGGGHLPNVARRRR